MSDEKDEPIITVAAMLHQLKGFKSDDESKLSFASITTEPMSRIIPGLYLSGIDAAQDKELLFEHNINAVLSVIDVDIKYDYAAQKITHKHLYTVDVGTFKIEELFLPAYLFVMEHLKQGENVLVHCAAGMSRSATIVMYVLMRYLWQYDRKGICAKVKPHELLDVVYEYVRLKRPIVDPNWGFMIKLMKVDINFWRSATW